MKPKRKLKTWVKIALLMIPEAVMIIQLFFIGIKINKMANNPTIISIVESRCYCD